MARDPPPSGGIAKCCIQLSPQSPRVEVTRRTELIARSARAHNSGRRAGSQRARNCDCADGELPLQDSNLGHLIQSSRVGVCLEGTMSASGDLPSIGAPTVGEECPDRSGETLVKCLQRLCASPITG